MYARVSTLRQQKKQTIEQQLERLENYVSSKNWQLSQEHIFCDDGYSGTKLDRPALDKLRDQASMAEFEVVLITSPDRLARNYVHQAIILQELEQCGCQVNFLDRPMNNDPHDQLVLQIRGAVAEYEHALIVDRMRRGRQRKLKAGQLLPWTHPPYAYVMDSKNPRDPSKVLLDQTKVQIVLQIFSWYADPAKKMTLYSIAKKLSDSGIPTQTGLQLWNGSTIRSILTNHAYTGITYAYKNKTRSAKNRVSALLPLGAGVSYAKYPPEKWIAIPVPAIIDQQVFDQVQMRLATNSSFSRGNQKYSFLLNCLVSCKQCLFQCSARGGPKYSYYVCNGKISQKLISKNKQCLSRYIPVGVLDSAVWQDLLSLIRNPTIIIEALKYAKNSDLFTHQLQKRNETIKQNLEQVLRQEERLLDAYLAEVITFEEFSNKRDEIVPKKLSLEQQQRQIQAQNETQIELEKISNWLRIFCQDISNQLEQMDFEQRRYITKLLIDRVVVNDEQVEIRYAIPTSEAGKKNFFCHLRLRYFDYII